MFKVVTKDTVMEALMPTTVSLLCWLLIVRSPTNFDLNPSGRNRRFYAFLQPVVHVAVGMIIYRNGPQGAATDVRPRRPHVPVHDTLLIEGYTLLVDEDKDEDDDEH